jgi:hypothetical protein
MSGTVEAPDGYQASAGNVVSLQMSPDFSGRRSAWTSFGEHFVVKFP